jgi:dTDP-4-dehydrorhamnose reductase
MYRKRIAVIGAGGRLGKALCRSYAEEFEVLPFGRDQVDLASPESVRGALESADFDVLVNCAALTNVDYCETHEDEARRINAEAVREIAEIASGKDARVIHISTDYVFGGDATEPYTEDDPAEAISVYGATKRLGEEQLLEVSDRNLAVRVSWVFGPDRPSFVDAILKRALSEETVEAIDDKYSSPAFTIDLATYLRPFLGEIEAGGLLHLCNTGECTWREYGEYAINVAADAGMPMKTRKVGGIKLADLAGFVAKRPVYTVLATDRFTALTGRPPRPWQEAVEDYVRNWVAKPA